MAKLFFPLWQYFFLITFSVNRLPCSLVSCFPYGAFEIIVCIILSFIIIVIIRHDKYIWSRYFY